MQNVLEMAVLEKVLPNFSNDNIDAYERLWSIILHMHTDKELTKLSIQSVS